MADPELTKPATPGVTRKSRNNRFRRHDRILDKASYGRVFKTAKRSRDQYFTVLYRPNGSRSPRLGLAIAKKHCKLATGRNRIKRIVRESFRQNKEQLHGMDIVVINSILAG